MSATTNLVLLLALVASLTQGQDVNIVETAKRLNLTVFVDALSKTGLNDVINKKGFFTVFAPTDEAFRQERKYPSEADLREKLAFHIARGRFMSDELKDEFTVECLLEDRTVRTNIYPNKAVTANGRRIVSVDHKASNGVIHVIDRVMSAVYEKEESVITEIDECCPEHSTILNLVKLSGLFKELDTTGPFTFFAPVNEAFNKLPPDFLIRLKQNMKRLRRFVYGHMVPLTWNSPGFVDGQTVKTLAGNKISVGVAKDGTITIGPDAQITLPDVTATNGVVHVIDAVLFPENPKIDGHEQGRKNLIRRKKVSSSEKTITETLRTLGYTAFADALVETKVDQIVEKMGHTFTVFAPSNEAFTNPHKYPHTATLEERVRFHIGRGVLKLHRIRDGQKMLSLLDHRFITLNRYDNLPSKPVLANGRKISLSRGVRSANNAHIIPLTHEAMDYVYSGSMLDELAANPDYSEFTRVISSNEYTSELLKTAGKERLTVLALNNDVMARYEELLGKDRLSTQLALSHVLTGAWYSPALSAVVAWDPKEDPVKTTLGLGLPVTSDVHDEMLFIAESKIVERDMTCSNGVIHEVDALIFQTAY